MKKLLAFVLSLLLLLSLTACGRETAVPETVAVEDVTYYLSEYTMQYDARGGVAVRTVYTYDDQWRMTSWTSYLEGAEGDEEDTRVQFSYSDDNTVITMTAEGSDTVAQFRRTFDENGRILQTEEYEGGVLVNTVINEYDEEGRLRSCVTTYPDHEFYVSITQTNTYDDAGNCIAEETAFVFTEDAPLVSRKECTYDEAGRILTESHFTDGEPDSVFTYTYDSNTMTRTCTEPTGISSGRLVYTYDDHGNQLRIDAYDGAEETWVYRQCFTYIGTDGSTVTGTEG